MKLSSETNIHNIFIILYFLGWNKMKIKSNRQVTKKNLILMIFIKKFFRGKEEENWWVRSGFLRFYCWFLFVFKREEFLEFWGYVKTTCCLLKCGQLLKRWVVENLKVCQGGNKWKKIDKMAVIRLCLAYALKYIWNPKVKSAQLPN